MLSSDAVPSPPADPGSALSLADVVSTGMSAAALAVSLAALGFTLLWRARPFIRVEYSAIENNDDADATPTWRLRVANRGNGDAWDVRIKPVPGDGLGQVELVGTLKPDQTYDQHLMITPFVALNPSEPKGEGYWKHGSVNPEDHYVVIRWRALPFIRWYRSKKVRPSIRVEDVMWYTSHDGDELGKSQPGD